MAPTDELLVSAAVLAEIDAIFCPARFRYSAEWAAVSVARHAFRRGRGVAWASRAGAEAARKRTQLILESLTGRGSVVVTRDALKVTRVRMSDEADAATRAALGLPSLFACRHAMTQLARFPAVPPDSCPTPGYAKWPCSLRSS